MKIISKFNNWQRINEQNELDVDPKEDRKSKRKANRRKFRKEDFISDSGATYTLIRQKDSDDNQDTFVLKGKGKDSPIWDKKGIVVKDVEDFLNFELFSGENEGKYDEDSIEMEKYREGKRKDRVKFTIGLVDQEKVKAEEEAKKKEEEEAKKKAEAEKAAKAAKAIIIPKNAEGENRIEIGQTSEVLPRIKETIRKAFVKKGFKMGSGFGMDWLDSDKLEEKDAVWVKALRAGFGMPVKDFISQGLVDKLVAQVEEWEKSTEEEKKDEASNESKIPTFESYMVILEQFDMEAAMKQMSTSTEEKKPAVKKKKAVSSGASTGFSKEQGDQFRKWANSTWTKKYYGKSSKFDLDETGGHDNSYIRRALAQAKKDKKNQTGPFAGFMFRNMWGMGLQLIIDNKLSEWAKKAEEKAEEKKEWSRTDADQKLAEQASQTIVDLFKNASWFSEFKGTFNDDEAGAIAKFSPWWTKNVQPTIDKLNDKDSNKKTLNKLFNTIISKMEGGTSNDTASWRIWNAANDTGKRYSVDTDF